MKNIILKILLENTPESFLYLSNNENISINDAVVIDTERGRTIGIVKKKEETDKDVSLLKKIIRKTNEKDLNFIKNKKNMENKAQNTCKKIIEEEKLLMKIVKVDYMLNYSKVIFYYTAGKRVDFRSLVKKLATALRSRIEMRQIGVRDAARFIGGIGICGQEICCKKFMNKLEKVSLDKVNKFNLVNEKIVGICGKFMCCLLFEKKCKREKRG